MEYEKSPAHTRRALSGYCILLRQGKGSHAVEAYAKGRQVVEHGGGGWRQDACHAKTDQRPIEPNDKAVVVLDAVH